MYVCTNKCALRLARTPLALTEDCYDVIRVNFFSLDNRCHRFADQSRLFPFIFSKHMMFYLSLNKHHESLNPYNNKEETCFSCVSLSLFRSRFSSSQCHDQVGPYSCSFFLSSSSLRLLVPQSHDRHPSRSNKSFISLPLIH